jgi:positive regulator of sigma E activity
MIEQGTIVEIRGDRTTVEMGHSAGCGRCNACFSAGGGKMHVETDTFIGSAVGDRVEIEIPFTRFGAIMSIFVLPLAAMLLGAFLGNYLTEVHGYPGFLAIVLALVLVALTYLGVYIYERRSGRSRPQPRILRRLPARPAKD